MNKDNLIYTENIPSYFPSYSGNDVSNYRDPSYRISPFVKDYINNYNYAASKSIPENILENTLKDKPKTFYKNKRVQKKQLPKTVNFYLEKEDLLKEDLLLGVLFNKAWEQPIPFTVDEEDNYHSEFPDVYNFGLKPRTFDDWVYDVVNSSVESNPLTSSQRVKNMLDANQDAYFNLSPRKISSGLALAGAYVPWPMVRVASLIPDGLYTMYDLFSNPDIYNVINSSNKVVSFKPYSALANISANPKVETALATLLTISKAIDSLDDIHGMMGKDFYKVLGKEIFRDNIDTALEDPLLLKIKK